ncbi:dTDP-4-amino-4,6-dideoxygalactose transaminase [Phycicoccus sp. CSK15P-2]|uniref:dTDP-4-amino-4,6-dideoxygalactose transaminase n=1 Tax=Phycicoccus sp. CSK15P-2 TaxID=2807627 RepID=UPI00194EB485|nr:dTDP-4-amino-4,6-dideoxygalactose transaminase [Phycicoccus sp. CSK15P-2]MBM6405958.1 dTDP-4-amino-4,6-dideoxygalactose transaminase [Phycicoccus sp. CSK15P-2]
MSSLPRPGVRRTAAPVRFTAPLRTGREQEYLAQVLASPMWHGDGVFTRRASAWLRELTGVPGALLTPSCTHALELAAILLGLGPGDEVVCPSFTFTSTATAIAVRGATPVFVDVRPDTLGLDVEAVRAALTPRTKAIFVVHYGGVAADIEDLVALADDHGIAVVEDNAHGLGARWRGRPLGTFGALAAQSFHDTKNITCGEGGALLVNDAVMLERAEVVREKGTDRSRFLRGEVDRYTWQDVGSSYLPSELTAAVLVAQSEAFDRVQARRHEVWDRYARELAPWAAKQGVTLMHVPEGNEHPAHVFYVLAPTPEDQSGLIRHLGEQEISAVFHYQPLDSSPAGRRLGRTPVPCTVSADVAGRIVRLPLHPGLDDDEVARVVDAVSAYRSEA